MAMTFAVLGTGHWASVTHVAAIAAHPEVELIAVWGRDRTKAAALAGQYGGKGYDDLDVALNGVDAVAIALPPHIQAPLAAKAARAGRHLLLDKPLALDVAAADDVVAAVAESGVANVVFFTSRFVPEVNRFLAGMAAEDWDSARVTMMGSIIGEDNPYRDSTWRYEHGGLWDLGPHALSLLIPVLGPALSVVAAPAPHGVTHVIATHQGGAVSTMALSVVSPQPRHEFVFAGPTRETEPPVGPAAMADPVAAFGVAIDQLLEQVDTGRRDHPCGVRFGREVTGVLAAAQQSRAEGRRIDLRRTDSKIRSGGSARLGR